MIKIIAGLHPFDWNDDNEDTKNIKIVKPVVSLENGAIYQGEWVINTSIREGRGIIIWKNGSRYDGFFKDGKA